MTQQYWNDFYRGWDLDLPSQFAVLVATEAEGFARLVDLGMGSGRDTLFFARRLPLVVGLDKSEEAVRKAAEKARVAGLSTARFASVDLGAEGGLAAELEPVDGRTLFYGRFFLHAIDEDAESTLLRGLHGLTTEEDRLYFEFRTAKDAATNKLFGEHYRRFIDVAAFVERCRGYGFACDYRVEGQGMAKYKAEDPWVARVILRPVL